MKSVVLAAAVAFIATPLAAQTAPAPAAASAPAVAAPATTATATGAAKFDLDTPIEAIAASTAGKAVLDTDLQNITAHPLYDQFKGMTLNQLAPLSQGALTDAALTKVKTDLAAIK
ncbi:MAG: hypothetical protein WCS75_08120 [Sphingomonas sp.]|jgi:hypothetical protein|uniref:hypothetical protein n=1 Tax=Sphingomonas sp. TaxID=28214 RepID=UPI003565FC2B